MRFTSIAVLTFAILALAPLTHALEKQPAAVYHARRGALAAKLNGGVAVLFAAEEPLLDFMPYRQDEDFYYLTGTSRERRCSWWVTRQGRLLRAPTGRFSFCPPAICAWKNTPGSNWTRPRPERRKLRA
jgi:hypothetical protein